MVLVRCSASAGECPVSTQVA